MCDFSSGKRLPFSRGRGGVVAGEFIAAGSGIECSTKKNKMGNGLTKEEQVYQAVQNGNHNAVKALRREGASLEVNIHQRLGNYSAVKDLEMGGGLMHSTL